MTEPIKKHARLTAAQNGELTERIVAMYAEGASIRDIADETNRAYGTINKMLAKAGVPLRPRGGNTRVESGIPSPVPRELTAEQAREYAERLRQRRVR